MKKYSILQWFFVLFAMASLSAMDPNTVQENRQRTHDTHHHESASLLPCMNCKENITEQQSIKIKCGHIICDVCVKKLYKFMTTQWIGETIDLQCRNTQCSYVITQEDLPELGVQYRELHPNQRFCQVCDNALSVAPYSLPCKHSFCLKCMHQSFHRKSFDDVVTEQCTEIDVITEQCPTCSNQYRIEPSSKENVIRKYHQIYGILCTRCNQHTRDIDLMFNPNVSLSPTAMFYDKELLCIKCAFEYFKTNPSNLSKNVSALQRDLWERYNAKYGPCCIVCNNIINGSRWLLQTNQDLCSHYLCTECAYHRWITENNTTCPADLCMGSFRNNNPPYLQELTAEYNQLIVDNNIHDNAVDNAYVANDHSDDDQSDIDEHDYAANDTHESMDNNTNEEVFDEHNQLNDSKKNDTINQKISFFSTWKKPLIVVSVCTASAAAIYTAYRWFKKNKNKKNSNNSNGIG